MDVLNERIIEELLQKDGEENYRLLDYNVESSRTVKKGDNYSSEALSICVKIEKNGKDVSKRYFFKMGSRAVFMSFVREFKIHDKEICMYTNILPKLNNFSKQSLSPKFFLNIEDDLILEDLSEVGFYTCDRIQQLDMEHTIQALQTLAKFHAASVHMKNIDADVFNDVAVDLVNCSNHVNEEMESVNKERRQIFFEILSTSVHRIPGTLEMIKDYIEDLQALAIAEIESENDSLKVLNHGDFWTSNLMFKKDMHGSVIDCRVVDYEYCCWASPCIDVLFFLITSVRFELIEKHFELLTHTYIANLNECLQRQQCQIYTIENFEKEWKRKINYALLKMTKCLPTILLSPENAMNLLNVDQKLKSFFSSRTDYIFREDKYQQTCFKWLQFFKSRI